VAGEDVLGQAVLLLSANSQKLMDDMARSKNAATNLQEHFSTVSGGIQSVLEGIGIGFSFGAMIRDTIEAENAQAQLAAAVQSTGMAAGFTASQLMLQSAALQNVTTFSDEAIQRMQATMLSFRNIVGDVFVRSQQVILDFAAATGRDASDAARTLGMALNDPVNGLTMLRRAGVSMSDALKENITDLAESGRLAEAQTLILNELAVAYGGRAAAAVDTLGGALSQLRNRFGDLFLEMQGPLRDSLVGTIQFITANLGNLAAGLNGAFGGVKAFIEVLTEKIVYFGRMLSAVATLDMKAFTDASLGFNRVANITQAVINGAAQGYEMTASSMARLNEQMTAAQTTAPAAAAAIQTSSQVSAAAIEDVARRNEAALRKMKSDEDKLAADKRRIREQNLSATQSSLSLLSGMIADANGKQSKEAKAAAIITATIDTWVAATKALASASPPYNYVLAAATFAAGMRNVAQIEAMETGGPVNAGQTYMVGEAGPELFTPDRSGAIIPNDKMGGSVGGGKVEQHFHASGMDYSSQEMARRFFQTGAAMLRSGAAEALAFGSALSEQSTLNAKRAHG